MAERWAGSASSATTSFQPRGRRQSGPDAGTGPGPADRNPWLSCFRDLLNQQQIYSENSSTGCNASRDAGLSPAFRGTGTFLNARIVADEFGEIGGDVHCARGESRQALREPPPHLDLLLRWGRGGYSAERPASRGSGCAARPIRRRPRAGRSRALSSRAPVSGGGGSRPVRRGSFRRCRRRS
jgi:hypothetical protein